MPRDPYSVLGVKPGVSGEELHDAYRRLVKLHHPDRNGGSEESTRRFQEIQQAYESIRSGKARPSAGAPPRPRPAPPRDDSHVASRMEDLERELREARDAAREALRNATAGGPRPTDEELGYYTTDDSFGAILKDVRTEVSERFSEARKHPAVKRVSDLVDGLDGLTDRFREKP
jgi:curved DNA-binding protein CbpA